MLAISAVCLGIALDQAEKQLMQNEVHTLYSYRLLDRTNSSLALYLRKLLF